jgi:hypothetical protein
MNSKGNAINADPKGVDNFWIWFGRSKAVDKHGSPLVMYHGTAADFGTFRDTRNRGLFSFTSTPSLANGFADRANGSVLPVYLSIQKPFDFRIEKHVQKLSSKLGKFNNEDTLSGIREGHWGYIEPFHKELKALGFDGIITQNKFDMNALNFHVFDPKQIKSATGNDGAFSKKTDVITANTHDEPLSEEQIQKVARYNLKDMVCALHKYDLKFEIDERNYLGEEETADNGEFIRDYYYVFVKKAQKKIDAQRSKIEKELSNAEYKEFYDLALAFITKLQKAIAPDVKDVKTTKANPSAKVYRKKYVDFANKLEKVFKEAELNC